MSTYLNTAYFTVQQLKLRGWTESMIAQFLGQPDKRQQHMTYSRTFLKLYDQERVRLAEEKEEFNDRKTLAAHRSQISKAVADRRSQETLDKADEYVVPELPTLTIEEVEVLAMRHYGQRNFDSGGDWDDGSSSFSHDREKEDEREKSITHRITVNYLRHECTDYDLQMNRFSNQLGAEDTRRSIRDDVLSAISERFPELRDECDRQRRRKEA